MIRTAPLLLLTVLMIAVVVMIETTMDRLPMQVASHFGGSGQPNDYMSHNGYRLFMLVFTIGLPLFVTLAVSALPRRFPRSVNLPHRDVWLAPERREESIRYLTRHGLFLGCLLTLFSGGIHLLILDAHHQSPPHLDGGKFLLLMVLFLIGVAVWIAALFRRFRKPTS